MPSNRAKGHRNVQFTDETWEMLCTEAQQRKVSTSALVRTIVAFAQYEQEAFDVFVKENGIH